MRFYQALLYVVMGVWGTLALARRRRSEPTLGQAVEMAASSDTVSV